MKTWESTRAPKKSPYVGGGEGGRVFDLFKRMSGVRVQFYVCFGYILDPLEVGGIDQQLVQI